MTLCQLTRHPVVIEEWKYYHSNWLIETSRMVVFLFFQFNYILTKNSSSNRLRRMGIPSFNSSRRASSNGGTFVLLRPLDLNGIWDGIWDWDKIMANGMG